MGHKSDKSLLLMTPSEVVDYKSQCVAFSGRKLAKSVLNDGRPSQMGSCSSESFGPRKPEEKSSWIDQINMAEIREYLRLYLYSVVHVSLHVLWKVDCFQFLVASGMRHLFPDIIRVGLVFGWSVGFDFYNCS